MWYEENAIKPNEEKRNQRFVNNKRPSLLLHIKMYSKSNGFGFIIGLLYVAVLYVHRHNFPIQILWSKSTNGNSRCWISIKIIRMWEWNTVFFILQHFAIFDLPETEYLFFSLPLSAVVSSIDVRSRICDLPTEKAV